MSQGNKRSSNSMKRGENLEPIPTDLILEILSRLPAKSISRFRCVSKLWRSMLCRPYFTELFLTRSSAHLRLLFAVRRDREWLFFSSPQPHNLYEKSSSLVVAADFHTKFLDKSLYLCSYASGLIYIPSMRISEEKRDVVSVICKPSTGQYVILPELITYKERDGVLGFDPIGKQFKVLLTNNKKVHILTLGTDKMRWRKIQCSFNHYIADWRGGICINGVLYYIGSDLRYESPMLVCFDVRSERFKFIAAKCYHHRLINYKGKLCEISLRYDYFGGFPIQLCMWVLEDVEKREWSTYDYTLRADNKVVKVNHNLSVVGMTARGEIVLAKENACKPFFVFYFNPEKNTLLSLEIQGFDQEWFNDHRVHAFVDHIEDFRFNVMKTTYAATSIRAYLNRAHQHHLDKIIN